MNAKQEFLRVTEKHNVLCATIMISHNWDDSTTFNLRPGYTPEQYQQFVDNLDFDYDDGYGTQHLFGTIWCDHGVWFDRHEYDGAESWEHHKYPAIPNPEDWGADKVVTNSDDYYQDYWDGSLPSDTYDGGE